VPRLKRNFLFYSLLLGLICLSPGQPTVSATEPVAQAQANVSIRVMGSLPEYSIQANDDYATTQQNEPVFIEVLANDLSLNSQLDNNTLIITKPPSHGKVEVTASKTKIKYTPNPGFYGQDQFTYRICNTAFMCDWAEVYIEVTKAPEPKPEPKPESPVDLPVTGGNTLLTVSLISSFTLLAIIFYFLAHRSYAYKTVKSKNSKKVDKR
jgi:hypothetical protein